MSEIKPITPSDSAYLNVRDELMDPIMRSLALPPEVLRKPSAFTPTPDHVWLRSVLLDPSPATFAAWSDWLEEHGRDREAEIVRAGRVPCVQGGFLWRCVQLLKDPTYYPGSWDKRFARDMAAKFQPRLSAPYDHMDHIVSIITKKPHEDMTTKQATNVIRIIAKYRKQIGNERLAAEARWVLDGNAPAVRGG